MVPSDRPLIDIGYKYKKWKVLSFIVTDNAGSTQSGIPYLSKYHDQFTNVAIHPVSHPLIMSKLFGSVNEVDCHNKSKQSYLALNKFWVTQCSWLRLCPEVAMGTTSNNFWKLFCCGVKRYHYEKLIGIREFPEQLSKYCLNNHF